jgi:pilus assembly protein CpaF
MGAGAVAGALGSAVTQNERIAMTQAMLTLHLTDANGETQDIAIHGSTLSIGRGSDCAVRLSGWRIGKEHARIVRGDKGWMLEDLGHLGGTWVNGARAALHGPLSFADQIQIGGYKLRVRDGDHAAASDAKSGSARRDAGAAIDLVSAKNVQATPARPATAEVHQLGVPAHAPSAEDRQATARLAASQARHPWRKRVHDQLLETIDLRRRDLTRMSDAELRSETERLIRDILDGLTELPTSIDREALRKEVLDEAVGLGPLEDLLADETVTEIMVNKSDEIFVEQRGRLTRYPLAFTSDRAVMGVIERIVAPLGRRIDESSPLVDARLRDGSRVNAIIPPLAIKGPTLTIRKFSKKRLEASDMVGFGSLDGAMVEFLRMCVHQRKNLIVSGGTGSGKTTLLNVLSNFIPDGERIVTIEDAAELRLNHSHLVSLESRPSNIEGRGAVDIRDLVRNALRMRPDRIVVGECRGGEALDMLQAMNTGHEGSLTTLHANTPRDALARLETLVLMAGMDLPITAIREQVVSAVDLIVQQTRFACGTRKITSITEVTGIENGKVQLQELFRFDQRGYAADNGKVQGQFTGCNAVPSFYDELRERGVECDLTLFDKKVA